MLSVLLLGLVTACSKKSNRSSRQVINSLSGVWYTKSVTCYSGSTQIIIAHPPDSYIKFNTDLSGQTYSGTPTMVYKNFGYDVLSDDTTLVFYNGVTGGGAAIPDTFVITRLTANQLIYHGANKVLHGTGPYICTNPLDSLFR